MDDPAFREVGIHMVSMTYNEYAAPDRRYQFGVAPLKMAWNCRFADTLFV